LHDFIASIGMVLALIHHRLRQFAHFLGRDCQAFLGAAAGATFLYLPTNSWHLAGFTAGFVSANVSAAALRLAIGPLHNPTPNSVIGSPIGCVFGSDDGICGSVWTFV